MHRALDGDGPAPLELELAILCDAFHCLPSAAWRERARLPAGLLEGILEARGYLRMKLAYDSRGRGTQDPPLMATVKAIDLELVTDARRARERTA